MRKKPPCGTCTREAITAPSSFVGAESFGLVMRRQRLGLDDEANRVVWHFQGDRSNHRRQRLGHGAAHSEGRVTSHLYSQRQQGTATVEVWRPSGSLGRTPVGVATATQDDERRDTSRPEWQQLNNKTATTGPWCGQATPNAATTKQTKNSHTNRLKKKGEVATVAQKG